MKYIDIILNGFRGYADYLYQEILFQYTYKAWYENYFYLLIVLSLLVWGLELAFPWRTKQGAIRKDFWLDVFYMFFNFFLFSLIGHNALSMVGGGAVQRFSGAVWHHQPGGH